MSKNFRDYENDFARIDTHLANFQNPMIWHVAWMHPEQRRPMMSHYSELITLLPPDIALEMPSPNRAFNAGFPGCPSKTEIIDRIEQVGRAWEKFKSSHSKGKKGKNIKPRTRNRGMRVADLLRPYLEVRTNCSKPQKVWARELSTDEFPVSEAAVSKALNHPKFGPGLRDLIDSAKINPESFDVLDMPRTCR